MCNSLNELLKRRAVIVEELQAKHKLQLALESQDEILSLEIDALREEEKTIIEALSKEEL